jgi:hypothetical protein
MSSNLEQRIADVEARLESAFALDARLKALDGDVRKLKGGSTVRDWMSTLAPYIGGLVVLFVGFWIKDKVALALQRESLDLQYVQQMRDLIKDFDEAQNQTAADANAIGLAMYGKYAIVPLVERLEAGDIASIAAEQGLRLVGSNDRVAACPKFIGVITDRARRYRWQTHKTMIKVTGQSECLEALADLDPYRAELVKAQSDPAALASFARRYSQPEAVDRESVQGLIAEIDTAKEILAGDGGAGARVER